MLNTFDTMLNIEIETPADANSKGPCQHKFKSSSRSEVGEENGKAIETCSVRVGVLYTRPEIESKKMSNIEWQLKSLQPIRYLAKDYSIRKLTLKNLEWNFFHKSDLVFYQNLRIR